MAVCPICGSVDCIKPADEVIEQSLSMYAPCNECVSEPPVDKFKPLVELCESIDRDYGRCTDCRKRHLDTVMAHVLEILIKGGHKSAGSSLKDVGTPLVEYGFTLIEPPRLPAKSVVMVIDNIDGRIARKILGEVPEIKGVLNRRSDPRISVGITDVGTKPCTYELLAGCDMRADIVNTLVGDLCLYRNQSECHIEFRRNNSVKIKTMEKLYLDGMMDGSVVVDGMASVGTLGFISAMAGARKVILNDAWLPAIKNLLINLEVNREALGVEVDYLADLSRLPAIGDDPVLAARASGNTDIEVYHGDFRKLEKVVPTCDLCIIDTFPGVSPEVFVKKWQEITTKKVITL
ncbi:MAG TPA: hypothetical protein VGK13_00755 [Methanocellaceae archaeon]